MKRTALTVLLAAGTLGFTLGCEEKSTLPAAAEKAAGDASKAMGDAAKKAGDVAGDAAKKMGDEFKALRDKAADAFSKELDGLKPTIDKAKTQIASLSAETKPMAEKAMTEAEGAIKAAQAKLGDLKGATADTWQKISDEIRPLITKATDAVKGLEKYIK